MKKKYLKMTKADLIKKIEEYEIIEEVRKKEFTTDEKDQLIHLLEEREYQIEIKQNELIETQKLLEESRDKYADLYDYAPSGYMTIDDKGVILDINLTASAMLCTERKFLIHFPFIHYLANGDKIKFINFLVKSREENKKINSEFCVKISNGLIYIEATSIPVYDYKLNKTTYRVSLSDISTKKRAEEALKESEARFRLMADASPVMIWVLNTQHEIEYVNKTKLKFTGRTLEEELGKGWFEVIHPDDLNIFQEIYRQAYNERKPFIIEIRTKDRFDKYRWLLNTAVPRFSALNEFIGYIGSEIDVTSSKEDKFKLEQNLKEKDILLKEIHHRVKNNLQVISSLINLQSYYINDSHTIEVLRSIQDRIHSMALLHEKLYRSKNITEINFKEYIQEIIYHLFASYNKSKNNIKLKLNISDLNPDIGLSIGIGLIINELVSNSLKHAFPEKDFGEINIDIKPKENNKLQLIVMDNGVGLPQNFNLHSLKSFGFELVSSLVDQHHGKIELNNNGKTEFKILFNSPNHKN